MLHLLTCTILVTSAMDDQYQLLQRTVHLIKLGAAFRIDGLAPNLVDQFQDPMLAYNGVYAIVDTGGDIACRGEMLRSARWAEDVCGLSCSEFDESYILFAGG